MAYAIAAPVATAPATATLQLFASSQPTELHEVAGGKRKHLITDPLVIIDSFGVTSGSLYPKPLKQARIGQWQWVLQTTNHCLQSTSSKGEATFTFSGVSDSSQDVFYCVVFKADTPPGEIALLEALLAQLTTLHAKDSKKPPGPSIALPTISHQQVIEVLRKGAEDTSVVMRAMGQMAGQAMRGAADMHKRFAPAPEPEPLKLDPNIKGSIEHTKQATAVGAAVAKGLAAGIEASTNELGASLAQAMKGGGTTRPSSSAATSAAPWQTQQGAVATAPTTGGSNGSGNKKGPDDGLALIGAELARDFEQIKRAMMEASQLAWGETKEATVGVYHHQYGEEAGRAASDVMDVAEGMAKIGKAAEHARIDRLVAATVADAAKHLGDEAAARQAAAGGAAHSSARDGTRPAFA